MTQRHISEDWNFQQDRCENLTPCKQYAPCLSIEVDVGDPRNFRILRLYSFLIAFEILVHFISV